MNGRSYDLLHRVRSATVIRPDDKNGNKIKEININFDETDQLRKNI